MGQTRESALTWRSCKRVDETADRKCQRPNDVEIIPTGDCDPAVSEQLVGRITNTATSSAHAETPASAEVENDNLLRWVQTTSPAK